MNFSEYKHLENAWYPTNVTLSRAIYKRPFSGTELRILECIRVKTYAYPRGDGKRHDRVYISSQDLASQIGIDNRTASRAVQNLVDKNVLIKYRDHNPRKQIPGCIGINSKVSEWKIEMVGDPETYPDHKGNARSGGRPIENKTPCQFDPGVLETPCQNDPGVSENPPSDRSRGYGKPPVSLTPTPLSVWPPPPCQDDPGVLYHAARNHAAGSSPTKTDQRSIQRESTQTPRQIDPGVSKTPCQDDPGVLTNSDWTEDRKSRAARVMVEMLSEEYFGYATTPRTVFESAQKLATDFDDRLDELGSAWQKQWAEMKTREIDTGKIEKFPQRIFELVAREMKIPKSRPPVDPIEYKIVEYVEPESKNYSA